MAKRKRSAAPPPAAKTKEPVPKVVPGDPGDPGAGVPGGKSVLELIREIQAGALDPRQIGAEDRRVCVAYLTAEGYSVPEIAQILRASDRTVHRDRERVRSENALRPSESLITTLVGQLSSEAATAVQRLRRLGREKEAPLSARVEAERAAWSVFREFVQSMQRLGYLPMAVPNVRADVTHRLGGFGGDGWNQDGDGLPQIEAMHLELARIESIRNSAQGGSGGVIETGVEQVRSVLLRLEAGERLREMNRAIESEEQIKENGDAD